MLWLTHTLSRNEMTQFMLRSGNGQTNAPAVHSEGINTHGLPKAQNNTLIRLSAMLVTPPTKG